MGDVVLLAVGYAFSLLLVGTSGSHPELTLWGWLKQKSREETIRIPRPIVSGRLR